MLRHTIAALGLSAAMLCSFGPGAFAEEASQIFAKKVRPLLEAKCFDCHSSRSDDVKSNLKLDSLDDIMKGGDNGPSVFAGDVEMSFLLRALRYEEADYQMPPSGKLSDEDIKLVEDWVRSMSTATNKRKTGN